MSVAQNLTVQYHQQDTDYYCGAACAQMVLQSIGAGLLDQDDLYADNHSHSTTDSVTWYTAPDGLQWTMNDRRPASFTNYFALFALSSEDQISRKLCWTIHHYTVAPIALVYGWAHWIVVRGYTASAHPATSADNSYSIDAFDVNNPWPPTPSADDPALAPPPPHSASDGCGTGGMRGIVNEHIAYATWQSTYMTGVPSYHWAGMFVAVCDPEPPAAPGGARRPPSRRTTDGKLLTQSAATEFAVSGLKEYGLFDRKDWGPVLNAARPTGGVLVQRLDHADSFYTITPFMADQRVAALVSVDGRFGNYRQAALLPKGADHKMINPVEALKLVVGKRLQLPKELGRLFIRDDAVSMYPYLVWHPCRESLSPYFPFHMLTVGRHRIYVRTDGAVFTSLRLDARGI